MAQKQKGVADAVIKARVDTWNQRAACSVVYSCPLRGDNGSLR
jgi:hypothetical protein